MNVCTQRLHNAVNYVLQYDKINNLDPPKQSTANAKSPLAYVQPPPLLKKIQFSLRGGDAAPRGRGGYFTPLDSILRPIIDPILVTFRHVGNFRDPNLVTFSLCTVDARISAQLQISTL